MRNEAKANEDSDKKLREEAEKLNMVDSLIFQTEKQLKDVGEKIPADKKAALESALADVKAAREKNDVAAMDTTMEALNKAWEAASQDIYNATQQQGNPTDGAQADGGTQQQGGDNVSDVEYEEVKDENK